MISPNVFGVGCPFGHDDNAVVLHSNACSNAFKQRKHLCTRYFVRSEHISNAYTWTNIHRLIVGHDLSSNNKKGIVFLEEYCFVDDVGHNL
jgi:hypothetical protein